MDFFSGLNLNEIPVANFVAEHNDTSAQDSNKAGKIYFNTDEGVFKFCDGTKWITLGDASQSTTKFTEANLALSSTNTYKQVITAATHGVKSKIMVQVFENRSGVFYLAQAEVSIAANGDVTVSSANTNLTGVVRISGAAV